MNSRKIGCPITILLVEDNPGDVRLTMEALKDSKMHNDLNVTRDGVEALAFLRREGKCAHAPRPDLILLDLNLPKKDGREVLANTISSQIDIHAKTGGVVPEVAAREHVVHMLPVLEECMRVASVDWPDIDALAVTQGPGLVSSLIIGTETIPLAAR